MAQGLEMLNERDWKEHVTALLGNLLDGLDEQRATELRQVFHDISSWARAADKLIELTLVDPKDGLVRYARTPVDLTRINNLINARREIDRVVEHLGAVIYAHRANGDVIIPVAERAGIER